MPLTASKKHRARYEELYSSQLNPYTLLPLNSDTMAPDTTAPDENYGLCSPVTLEKIDKLFACGVDELVNLPQIVVVGDQSSGKSSVLEGLIKKPLPRDSGLCTRFATQIVFRRAKDSGIAISIIPERDASQEHISHLKTWSKSVPSLDSGAFTKIMEQVSLSSTLVASTH